MELLFFVTFVARLALLIAILAAGLFVSDHVVAGDRKALVVGNAGYVDIALRNTINDAKGVAADLQELGFEVFLGTDLNRRSFEEIVRKFSDAIKPGDVAVFFYAGHGIQYQGENYMIPLDADIQHQADLQDRSISLRRIMGYLEATESSLNIIILDACRDNPFIETFRGSSRGSSGLAQVQGPRGTLLAYATRPGAVALDGAGDHSPYTEQLRHFLKQPGLSLTEMFNEVALAVLETTQGRQEPWISASALRRFCFSGCESPRDYTNTREQDDPDISDELCQNKPLSSSEIANWLKQYQNALQSKDMEALLDLGAVLSREEAEHLHKKLRARNEYRVMFGDLTAKRYPDKTVLGFERVDQWRDETKFSTVLDYTSESITLRRKDCERVEATR